MLRAIFLLTVAMAILAAVDLWVAQMIVWGLSLYHVDSGIFGPWLLMSAATSVVAGGVAIGQKSD